MPAYQRLPAGPLESRPAQGHATPSGLRALLPGSKADRSPEAAALKALDKNRVVDLQGLLVLHPELLTAQSKTGKTLLTRAASTGNQEAVAVILSQARASGLLEPVVNHRDQEGRSALAHAALQGKPVVAMQLLQIPETNVNLQDKEGLTPLYHAVSVQRGRSPGTGQQVALAILARSDATPDLTSVGRSTPMEKAIERDKAEIARAIANHPEANPNLRDTTGMPPLWQAMERWAEDPDLSINRRSKELFGQDWNRDPNRLGRLGNATLSVRGTMLRDLMANRRVDTTAQNHAGETALTYLCNLRPDAAGMQASGLDRHTKRVAVMLAALLKAGRDNGRGLEELTAPNRAGKTPLEVLRNHPYPALLIQVLEEEIRQRSQPAH